MCPYQFYTTHFIPKMPPDMEMMPLSRTIGTDQLVDEMVVRFTHTVEMDWMLPGIAPTGKRVEICLQAAVADYVRWARHRQRRDRQPASQTVRPVPWKSRACDDIRQGSSSRPLLSSAAHRRS